MSMMWSGRAERGPERAALTSDTGRTGSAAPVLGHDDIGGGDRLVEAVEADGDAADPFGETRATIGRAVGDEDVGAAGTMEGDRNTFAHRSGTDDEHPLAGQVADDLGDHLDRGVADRGGAAADARFGSSTLAGLDRRCGTAGSSVERAAPSCWAISHGAADLAEDLALAEHGGVEPGGHFEQMTDRGRVVLAVQMRDQFVDGEIAELAEEVTDVARRRRGTVR